MSQAISAPLPEADGHFVMIPLTQGKFALVDEGDAEWIMSFGKWHAAKRRHACYASVREAGPGGREIFMHMLIAGIKGADHANRNGLDNRRVNLRPATQVQQNANQGLRSDNTSGYKGVTWYGPRGKWMAYIKADGRRRHLGYFADPHAAAYAYNRAALEAFGEFAYLNPLPSDMIEPPAERVRGNAKLTEEIVRECRARIAPGVSCGDLGREFGVRGDTIREAVTGVTWRHVADAVPDGVPLPAYRGEWRSNARLTEAAVKDIRTRYAQRSASASELARSYGIAVRTVWDVIYRKTWKHVA